MRYKWMDLSLKPVEDNSWNNNYIFTIKTKYGEENFPYWEYGAQPPRDSEYCILPLLVILEEYYTYISGDTEGLPYTIFKKLKESHDKLKKLGFTDDFVIHMANHIERMQLWNS